MAALICSPASAQTTKLVFGPLDGDIPDTAFAYEHGRIDIDVWIRTAPGISIVAFHLPLSSKDIYIRGDSLNRGDLYSSLSESWDVTFMPPNPDDRNPGYTSRSLIGMCADPGDCDPVQTEGQWWKIARFIVTAM